MNTINLKNVSISHASQYRNTSETTPLHVIDLDGCLVWVSYDTIIAVTYAGQEYICENVWSNTTGRHLNTINPDKSIRMKSEDFEQLLIDIKIKVSFPTG